MTIIRGEKLLFDCDAAAASASQLFAPTLIFSSANCRRIFSRGITVASARRTKITLPIIAESEMTTQFSPMMPRLSITLWLVPIFRPMTAMRRISAAFVVISKAFSTGAGRPRQFMAAPKARQMKGMSVFIIKNSLLKTPFLDDD